MTSARCFSHRNVGHRRGDSSSTEPIKAELEITARKWPTEAFLGGGDQQPVFGGSLVVERSSVSRLRYDIVAVQSELSEIVSRSNRIANARVIFLD